MKYKEIIKKNTLINKLIVFKRWIFSAIPSILPVVMWRIRFHKGVFLVMTPEHNNLGDHAITISEIQLLNDIDIPYYEITRNQIQNLENLNLLSLLNNRLILVCGGGNLGTLWFSFEELFRSIIINNDKSVIFCLPNTVFYEDSEWGRSELEKSIKIYNNHKHLRIYARESISYNIMQPIYNDVVLVPDMVFALKATNKTCERDGCLLCLRNDKEKTRTDNQDKLIENQVQKIFEKRIRRIDMLCENNFSLKDREILIEEKMSLFCKAELVITDRLHGMLFAAITGTPCIVIDSKSPKLKGCYEWIKNFPYIRFCHDICEIESACKPLLNKSYYYDSSHLSLYFEQLKNDILNWRNF